MKVCCEGFMEMYKKRFDRFMFVFADKDNTTGEVTFWLGMRCVEHKELKNITKISVPDNLPITINTSVPIHFCPWCGKKLIKYYKHRYDFFLDMEIQKEFNTDVQK